MPVYQIADVPVQIDFLHPELHLLFLRYAAPAGAKPILRLRVTEAQLEREIRLAHGGAVSAFAHTDVAHAGADTDAMATDAAHAGTDTDAKASDAAPALCHRRLEELPQDEGWPAHAAIPAEYEFSALLRVLSEQFLSLNRCLFHASALAVGTRAFLFAGPSGIGKSTHAAFWQELLGENALVINDDKPFLRVSPDSVWACGSPWDGKRRLSRNVSIPLKAICFLRQSRENSISPISTREGLGLFLNQLYRPTQPELLEQTLLLADRILRVVPLYRLDCTATPDAARLAIQTLAPEAKEKIGIKQKTTLENRT